MLIMRSDTNLLEYLGEKEGEEEAKKRREKRTR